MRKAILGRVIAVIMIIALPIAWAQVSVQTLLSDGSVLEDYGLDSAGDLVDICTLTNKHPDNGII